MPGQALMCVWQVVTAAEPQLKGAAPASRVRHITIQFSQSSPDFRYAESAFQAAIPGNTVDFERYREYVANYLVSKTMPQPEAELLIEEHCWGECRDFYEPFFTQTAQLSNGTFFQLWQMFNRICDRGSCPPVVDVSDMNWWANKLAAPMNKYWTDLPLDAAPMTYLRAVEMLCAAVFTLDALKEATQSVEQLHSWIVLEVGMTGWLYKRTRKHANNWTSWMRRFCVLTPGQIKYYTSAQKRPKDYKGTVAIMSFSRLESLNSFKGMIRTYPNRFRISNQPVIELEVSAVFEHEKSAWMAAITEVIDACKKNTTPVQAVLAERHSQHVPGQPRQTIDQAVARLRSKRLSKIPDSLKPEEFNSIPVRPPSIKAPPKDDANRNKSSSNDSESDSEEEKFDNNTYAFEKTKVREVFNQIDSNQNGLLSEREFDEFMRVLTGQAAGPTAYLPIFEELVGDAERVVTFPVFYAYFTRLVLDQTPASPAKAALRAEFLRADRQGQGAVDFKDLAEFVWDRRRSFRYRKLLETLDASPAQRESWCPVLTAFISLQYGGDGGFGRDWLQANALDEQLSDAQMDSQADAQMESLAERVARQWDAFTTALHLRSTDPERIASRFSLVDVACYTTSPADRPPLLATPAARWQTDDDDPQLVLPADSDLQVPAVSATDGFLRYYGCRLADAFHEQVAQFYEHRIENLGYSNQTLAELSPRMAGGPGLDKASLSRFDCPLSDHSGHLILARWEGDEETLEVTAFRVPANQSVYLAPGTLFSLDYADGSWRTLTHPAPGTTEHAQLKRRFTDSNERDLENVRFNVTDVSQ